LLSGTEWKGQPFSPSPSVPYKETMKTKPLKMKRFIITYAPVEEIRKVIVVAEDEGKALDIVLDRIDNAGDFQILKVEKK
jgi:hypothetical protein